MQRPVELVLAILCVASLSRPFVSEMSALEVIGYIVVALLTASLILVLHLRPNDTTESIPPLANPMETRAPTKRLLRKE